MNRAQLESQLIVKAAADTAFREQLLANPRKAIASIIGKELPGEIEVTVFEETPNRLCLVLPPQPAPTGEIELSEADLEGVAGGRMARRYSKEELNQPESGD